MYLEKCYFQERIDSKQTLEGRRKNFNDGFVGRKKIFLIPCLRNRSRMREKGREELNRLDSCSYAALSDEG